MIVRNYKDVTPIDYMEKVKKRVVVGPKEGAPNFVMRVFELAPGFPGHFHSHDWEHEALILSGEGVLMGEKGETPLKPGDVVFVVPNEKHGFKNKGQDPLCFVCIVPLRGEDTIV